MIASASALSRIPVSPSMRACAIEPATSWRHSRLSNRMEAFIACMTAAGPATKRPPHARLGSICEGSPMRLVSAFLPAALLLGACSADAPPGGGTADPLPSGGTATGQESPARPATIREDRLLKTFAGTPAPDLALETGPNGTQETLADIRAANPGQPILVNLWATWCAPCLKELPTLDRLAAETRGRLVVVPISQDMEGWRVVEPAFDRAKYPNLQTRLESQMQFGAALGATGLPVTILYDPQGREVWRYNGDFDWASPQARALIGL
jgi:thiol-disulfide isomerase/thioredoxin